ncbi:MAG: hypothetical protein ABUK11_04575 [Mariprofundaceae bacterium]
MKFGLSTARATLIRIALTALFLAVFLQPAHAFYFHQDENSSLEMRGMLQGSALALRNPDAPLLYNDRHITGIAASGRLMIDAGVTDLFSFEMHSVLGYAPIKLQTGGSNLALLRDVERSGLLDWSFDDKQGHLLIDRINLQFTSSRVSLKIGRQPLNFAATFYFTPNDFFAPFAAQTFFRAYKPGVDALRADIQLPDLSQISLISVLGYSVDASNDNGWSNRPDTSRNSYLGRASTVMGDFEFALLGGTVKKDRVLGIDFQGELFDWLGVRGEGHIVWPDSPLLRNTTEFALGVEHRWENSFTIRVEQFYHGAGALSATAYNPAALTGGGYLARHYTAVGASYEFTPLLTGDATAIHNWVDHSSLLALYSNYSLSDESELAISATIPMGRKPVGTAVRSEFGLLPYSLSVEARIYF